MLTEAIILAGGLGTRLRSEIEELPKSMAPINNKPFLHYQLEFLSKCGIKKVYLAVGYKSNYIESYFSHNYAGINIEYILEKEPLGTGGAVFQALKNTQTNHILVCNGDTMFNVPIQTMYAFHTEKKSCFTLGLKFMKDFDRYGIVNTNDNYQIKGFEEKQQRNEGWINGGVYIIDKNTILKKEFPKKFSLEKEFLEKEYQNLPFFGFESTAYFLDIGIPEDYHRAQNEFKQFEN